MSYAAASDLLARYDARTVGNLCSDNGVTVSAAALATDTRLQAALDDASGEIEAALMQGERYTTTDLAALTGNSLAYLKSICCKIAMAHLWQRRPYLDDESAEKSILAARAAIDRLRKGESIFNVAAVVAAGTPDVVTPTVTSIQALNLTVDDCRRWNGYYPQRRSPGISY